MQFRQAVFLTALLSAVPSFVTGAVIPASGLEERDPSPVAAAAGSDCSTVAGAVGVSVVCNTPNGKTIDGQPAQQVKQNGLQATPAAAKKPQPTKAKAQAQKASPAASAAGQKCSTVPGAVGVAVVCNGPQGKTIDGKPANQVQ